MPAAEFDRRITLQQRLVMREPSMGGQITTWPDIATVYAQVVESSEMVAPADSATEPVQLYARPMKIRIRWRPGVDKSNTRIVYSGRVLRITGTAELGRRRKIELACEEWAHE